jgi:ferritin-like metal-binding protein YciE
MAAYGAAREIARVLGQTEHASLLEKTLAEEKQTDEKLADLSKEINSKANEEGSEEQRDSFEAGKKTPKHAA